MKKMKKAFYTSILMFLVLTVMTGCIFEKRTEKKITDSRDPNITVYIKIPDKIKYKLSKELKDFKSSIESAMIIEEINKTNNSKSKKKDKNKDTDTNTGFMIGVEINRDMSYEKYKGSFDKLKKGRSQSKDFKEVTYSGIKGFQRYNEDYMRYEVYLPIKGTNERCLKLNVYSQSYKEGDAKKEYQSKEVQDILNHVKVKYDEKKDTSNNTKKETKKDTKKNSK